MRGFWGEGHNGTCATPPTGTPTYTYVYDRFGNRWQQNGSHSMQLTFSGANNRMDGYTYDAAGNLTNDGSHQYFYDAENHLIQVDGTLPYCSSNGASGTAATACYFYDAEGRRVRNTAESCYGTAGLSGGIGYVYDLSGRWVMSVPTNATPQAPCSYEIYAGGRHFSRAGGVLNFSHSDWLGTERVRTGALSYINGQFVNFQVCESIASLPFGDGQTTTTYPGNGWPTGCPNDSNLHFTGKERDPETGLDNFGARFNASSFGRFMSPDKGIDQHPEAPQSWNLYSYAMDNPLNLVDPTGEYVCGAGINQAMCDNFQKSLDAAQADANKLKEAYGANSQEYKDTQRAVDVYGKEGVDNGVTLTLGGVAAGAEGQVDRNVGSVTPTADNPLGQKITVHFAESAFSGSADNAVLVGHEGSHAADASDWVKSGFSPGMNPGLYWGEWRAFHVSQSIAEISGYGPLGYFIGQDQKKTYIWQPAWTRQAGWGKKVDAAIDSLLRDRNGPYHTNPNVTIGLFKRNTKGNQ